VATPHSSHAPIALEASYTRTHPTSNGVLYSPVSTKVVVGILKLNLKLDAEEWLAYFTSAAGYTT